MSEIGIHSAAAGVVLQAENRVAIENVDLQELSVFLNRQPELVLPFCGENGST